MAEINKFAHLKKVDDSKRKFLTIATTTVGFVGIAAASLPFIKSMNPAANVKATASIEVDVSEIGEGETQTVIWRGKPVFIKHRTGEEIAEAKKDDTAKTLDDPQKDSDRTQRPEWLIALAVCTHFGCVPNKGGNYGGWLCPCHGSEFDNSGRVRRGPAPTNLEIPPYKFLDDTTIKIG